MALFFKAKTGVKKEREVERFKGFSTFFKERSSFDQTDASEFAVESQLAGGSSTEKLRLDQEAIDKIIGDVLGGPGGLATIFGAEKAGGIFSSTVAAQASGDLAANIVGELAKLTAVRETTSTDRSQQVLNAGQRTITREQEKEAGREDEASTRKKSKLTLEAEAEGGI